MSETSKVTKVLIHKIHGKRKQDSKFWQSEFEETGNPNPKKGNFIESFTLFLLFFIGIGVVAYGGIYLYNRYSAEFTNQAHIAERKAENKAPASDIANRTKQNPARKPPAASIADKPITQRQLDKAIEKALADRSAEQHSNTIDQANNFYYRVDLVNGGKIEAESATRDGDLFTIKDRKGLVISVNRNEIKNVRKIRL